MLLVRLNLLFVLLLLSAFVEADITAVRQVELESFLEQDCGSCHGLQRRGGLGSPLLPESLRAVDDATLVQIILEGIPGTAMPPWKALLSEEEAAFLVQQLRKGLIKK
ncbi:MAG: c-type cytochrome [Parahaliea sp.]